MARKIDQMPIELGVMIPFPPLPEFAAHEQKLLAWLAIHPGVEQPQIRELLPFVARHLGQERAFAIDDFIMAQYEDEIFVKRIEQEERDVAVMIPAKNRIEAHVFQKIVHPTHVPLKPEAQPAEIGRA